MIKILLVEDDLGLSNSVFDFLDDFADVMQVFDGEEGLYEAESGVYDLILLSPNLANLALFLNSL